MKRYIQSKQGSGMIKGIGVGIGVSLTALLILTGILSAILIRGVLAEEYGRIIQMLIHSISVLIGCLVNYVIANGKILLSSIAVGMGYSLICVFVNALMFGADYYDILLTISSIIAGMVIAILLSIAKQTRGKRKYAHWKS